MTRPIIDPPGNPYSYEDWANERAEREEPEGLDYQLAKATRRLKRLMAEDAELLNQWKEAYLAFKGAFDTPQMRRALADDYSADARKRLSDFDEQIRTALKAPT